MTRVKPDFNLNRKQKEELLHYVIYILPGSCDGHLSAVGDRQSCLQEKKHVLASDSVMVQLTLCSFILNLQKACLQCSLPGSKIL